MPELTDAEVFGAAEMTDADVFGTTETATTLPPPARPLPQPPAPPDTPEGRALAAELEGPTRGPLFARPGVLARSPVDIPEVFQTLGGQLLHPIKSTEAAIEQFTGAPKFSGRYAPPVKHVSEILELGPKIPKIPQQQGTVAQAGAGVANAITSFVDFFLTTSGALTLGIGSLPKLAQKAVLTEFAAGMAVDAPEQLREGVRLLKEGKVQEGTEHLTSGIGEALLSAKIASHIPERPAPTFGVESVARAEQAPPERQPQQIGPRLPPIRRARPEVPETAAPERLSAVAEIRRADARTTAAIQRLFPERGLSREEAREFRNVAWGTPEQPLPAGDRLRAAKAPLTAAVVEQTVPVKAAEVTPAPEPVTRPAEAPPPTPAVSRTEAEPKVTAIEMDDFRHLIKKAADAPTPKTPEELADTVVKALTEVLPKQGETPGKRLLMEFGISKADVMPLSESEVLSELKGIAANPADWKVVPGTYKANQLEYLLKQAKAPTPPAEAAPVVGKAPAISEKQITDLAESKSIPWDYDPAFMDFTEGLTGKRHLSELNAEQRGSVFEAIQARPAAPVPVEAKGEVTPAAPAEQAIAFHGIGSLREKQATAPGELLPAKEMPFNLAGEREATPVPLESKPTVPVEQGELFQVQRITSIKDPAKSADAAQELYGNAFAAARTLRRQLDVIDSDPQTRKSFKKTQRAALNEVLRMLDERAAKTEAAAPRPELRIDALDMGERDFTMPVLRTLPMRDKAKWEKVKKYFGATSVPKIAELAKRRFEQRRIPSPEVERQAFLSGSHIAGIPDPISLAFAVTFGTKTGRETLGNVVRFYSEPLTERLASEGGQNSKGFANMGKEIAQRAKELFGSITPTLDPALEATGKMNRTTTWLNDIAETPRKWGYRNAVRAVEGPIEKVPAEHRPTVELLKASNLDIGKLAEPAVEGFKATGRYQRPPTAVLIDAIRAAKGPVYETVMQALAAENAMPLSKVKKIFKDIKAEFDEPGSKQTVHRIAQEFERHFKKFPTDIKVATPFGEVWVPILHAKPFDYLQNAAQRTAQRVAFLERVPQGTLAELRKQVVSELKDPSAFDDLIRALHGLPVNEPLRLFAPGTIQEMIASGANRVLSDVFAPLKLTVSAIYNIPETILGNASAFGGYRNFIKGAVTLKARHEQLEILGAINRAIYNFSWDPKAPIRSILADFRQGLRKVTLQQFFNEMQEMLAASTAQVFAERAQGRVLSAREQGLFTETATAMGFNRLAANAMARGNGTIEQYGNFVRRSAAFSAGGNIQPAEMSRFGGNRVLGGLFKFQSYPIMQLNAFRKAYTNFADAIESKDPRRIKASSEILAKFLFNTTARGAAAAFLAALLSGRGGGVQQTAEEAEDNPGKFVFDSVAGGMGGPVSAINYVVGTGKARDLVNPKNINAGITFPGSIYLELKQLFNTEGPYAGMTLEQATEKYLHTRVPAGKMIRHGLEEAGLVSGAETARGNLYRIHQEWLRRNPDPLVREKYERDLDQVFGESQYAAVRAAMRARDETALKKAVAELQSKKVKLSDIKEQLQPRVQGEGPTQYMQKTLFHESRKLERDFVNSLSPAKRKLYDAALREREAQWTWFRRYF